MYTHLRRRTDRPRIFLHDISHLHTTHTLHTHTLFSLQHFFIISLLFFSIIAVYYNMYSFSFPLYSKRNLSFWCLLGCCWCCHSILIWYLFSLIDTSMCVLCTYVCVCVLYGCLQAGCKFWFFFQTQKRKKRTRTPSRSEEYQ